MSLLPRILLVPLFVLPMLLSVSGCGSTRKAQLEEMTNQNLRLKYELDSVTSANKRLMQQVDALASENRVLTARASDLEVRLRDMEKAPTPVAPPPSADAGTAYAEALAQYRRLDFSGALAKFDALLKGGVRDDLADNCHYWIGECLYGMGKYADAIGHFETALNYATSEKKDDSMLMIANCHAAMGNMPAAREWYNRMITSYPASPYVKRAQEKLSALG
jgi:TolA-binding protein